METTLQLTQGTFELQRLPRRNNEKLRAWDAADEYLLEYLSANVELTESSNILILNDSFGAIAVAFNQFKPTAISDSCLSQQATLQNLVTNKLSTQSVQLRNSLDWPEQKFDLILIKIPKTLALFEDQLIHLQQMITKGSIVIAAGMIKTMPTSTWKLMERYLGVTKPSLAKKKARLIFTDLDADIEPGQNPYPVYYQLENTEYQICNHANVFSRDSLDIGTRFLLQHLPNNLDAKNIVDLGCGNGVVGLMLAKLYGEATLYFVDESYMAVASAKENFQLAFAGRQANFNVTDGLIDFTANSMDLIVCNPPFHQQHSIGNQIALSMFRHSYRVLNKGGQLWVIGNRHLGYHLDLKKIFKQCTEISSNKKFVIWRVIK